MKLCLKMTQTLYKSNESLNLTGMLSEKNCQIILNKILGEGYKVEKMSGNFQTSLCAGEGVDQRFFFKNVPSGICCYFLSVLLPPPQDSAV